VKLAGLEVGMEITFTGEGEHEVGVLSGIDEALMAERAGEVTDEVRALLGKEIVKVDPKYFRPTEVELLIGDPTKSMQKLGWKPEYDLQGLIVDMMRSDVALVRKDLYLKKGGFGYHNYFE
jgi:GDPmannose 4,6-dehydratase